MAIVQVQFPIYVPAWAHPSLQRLKRLLAKPGPAHFDLNGDRDVEWSFIAAHLPDGPGQALDFGCDATYMSLIAARRGFQVVALDLERHVMPWQHPNRRFEQCDLLDSRLPEGLFDLVINCSSVEHVGLVGRYSVSQPSPDGDLEAMRRLRELMKPGGIQLLTTPVGQDAVFNPWHRVYGDKRLPSLVQGYDVKYAEFWCKSQERGWVECERIDALNFEAAWDAQRKIYALGCFVLRRPIEG